MSESPFRCFKCCGSHFSTLLEAVQHVMAKRGTGAGSRGIPVQCCVQGCSKKVSKLRQHIRKFHKKLCPVSCSDCPAKFVERIDLNNHLRNGCPRRKPTDYRVTTPGSLIAPLCHRTPRENLYAMADVWGHLCFRRTMEAASEIETFVEDAGFRYSSASVNNFIANELQLDDASRDAVSKVVDRLYKHLQHYLPFSIHNLVKGGSIGKGTAVRDKADIDCVVFLSNVKTMEEHKRLLQTTMDHLESCLKQSPFKNQITFDGQTPFAVKFKIRLDSSREFKIDLLPTFTTDLSPEQLYKQIIGCATKDRGYYSAHFVNLQKEFVKDQPPIVKNLIRLVKYWRKTCIEDKSTGNTRLPASYPLELITIAWWENAGKPPSFDIRAGFKAVLQQLVDNRDIRVIWYNYYGKALAERGINGMSESRPFVLDPANPTNNVCSASDAEGWKIVADVAKKTLQRLSH